MVSLEYAVKVFVKQAESDILLKLQKQRGDIQSIIFKVRTEMTMSYLMNFKELLLDFNTKHMENLVEFHKNISDQNYYLKLLSSVSVQITFYLF